MPRKDTLQYKMKKSNQRLITIAMVAVALTTPIAKAATVKLAVATNFTDAMKQIATAFEQDTGHQSKVSYASSGKLFAQIQHGAPYDVFLSADTDKPVQLAQKQLAIGSSRFTYAQGQLVLWAPGLSLVTSNIQSTLSEAKFAHFAIANAKLAPYGVAAMETLKTMGVYQTLKPKLVQGENIGQTYQYIHSRNAQMGFVAYAQLIKTGHHKGDDYWIVDNQWHAPIEQTAILLTQAKNSDAAKAFMRYLQSPKAKAIIKAFGYNTPD